MGMQIRKQTVAERVLDADTKASKWLADANEARESGQLELAAKCDGRSQYWLDRFNLLSGRGDSPAPKR